MPQMSLVLIVGLSAFLAKQPCFYSNFEENILSSRCCLVRQFFEIETTNFIGNSTKNIFNFGGVTVKFQKLIVLF